MDPATSLKPKRSWYDETLDYECSASDSSNVSMETLANLDDDHLTDNIQDMVNACLDEECNILNSDEVNKRCSELKEEIKEKIEEGEIQEKIKEKIEEGEIEEGEIKEKEGEIEEGEIKEKIEEGEIEEGEIKEKGEIEFMEVDENFDQEKIITNVETKMIDGDRFENFMEIEIMPHKEVYGVLAMYFPSKTYNPKEYTLSTMTHTITKNCDSKWRKKLNEYIRKLDITHLFVAGEKQKNMIIQDVNVPIRFIGKMSSTYPPKCSTCLKYGCSKFKAKKMIKEAHKNMYVYGCE